MVFFFILSLSHILTIELQILFDEMTQQVKVSRELTNQLGGGVLGGGRHMDMVKAKIPMVPRLVRLGSSLLLICLHTDN